MDRVALLLLVIAGGLHSLWAEASPVQRICIEGGKGAPMVFVAPDGQHVAWMTAPDDVDATPDQAQQRAWCWSRRDGVIACLGPCDSAWLCPSATAGFTVVGQDQETPGTGPCTAQVRDPQGQAVGPLFRFDTHAGAVAIVGDLCANEADAEPPVRLRKPGVIERYLRHAHLDRADGTRQCLVPAETTVGDVESFLGSQPLSADGRWLLYTARRLKSDDPRPESDLPEQSWLLDTTTGAQHLLSRSSAGAPADGNTRAIHLAADGSAAYLSTDAKNLPTDGPGRRLTCAVAKVPDGPATVLTVPGEATAAPLSMSWGGVALGGTVVVVETEEALVAEDRDGVLDVYLLVRRPGADAVATCLTLAIDEPCDWPSIDTAATMVAFRIINHAGTQAGDIGLVTLTGLGPR